MVAIGDSNKAIEPKGKKKGEGVERLRGRKLA
jgi:hypothetical protein